MLHALKAAFTSAALLATASLLDPAAAAQFPTETVRILTTFSAGSGPDVVARLLAEKLSAKWNQQVIVDPRPGGSGAIAADALIKSDADGHNLILMGSGELTITPSMQKNVSFNAADFAPVSNLYRTAFMFVVSTKKSFDVRGIIAEANKSPGKISYGSPFIGSPSHLGGAMFETLTNTKMLHVPAKPPQAYVTLAQGDIDWALMTEVTARTYVKNGQMKFLAVAAKERVPYAPDVPTVAEAGGPSGFEVEAWTGLLAPKGTPADIVAAINRDVHAVLADPEIKKRLAGIGFEPFPSAPNAFSKLIKADTAKYGNLIKQLGLQTN